jgi:hypothetical protein
MLKIIAVVMLSHTNVAPGEKIVFGPDDAGRYAVLGEGFIPTKSCTVTAEGMTARFDGRFITFYDRQGEEEAQCEAGRRPTKVEWHGTIRRPIAVVR